MEDDESGKPRPGSTGISGHSNWDSDYFFSSDHESSILSEFGWNLQNDTVVSDRETGGCFSGFDQIELDENSDLAGSLSSESHQPSLSQSRVVVPSRSVSVDDKFSGGGDAVSPSNQPSVSSSSSEEPPENSTGSDGKLPKIV